MNQYSKRGSPKSSVNTRVTGDLLTPPSHKLPPAELIRRTLARRSFCGPSTGEIPSTFIVTAPQSTDKFDSCSSKDGDGGGGGGGEGGVVPKRPSTRRPKHLNVNSTPGTPTDRPVSPHKFLGQSTPSTPATARVSDPTSPPAGAGGLAVDKKQVQPTPPARRRQLPNVPSVAVVKMRPGPPNRTPSDRGPVDARRSPYTQRLSSNPRPSEYPPKSLDYYPPVEGQDGRLRSPPHEGMRRGPMPPDGVRNQKDFLRHPGMSRSEMDLSQRPRSLRIPHDGPPNEYYSRSSSGGPPYPPSHPHRNHTGGPPHHQQQPVSYPKSNPDLHSPDQQLAARHSAPVYSSSGPPGPPSKPTRSSTLPRRPHSTHGEPNLSATNFGSLPRHHHSSQDRLTRPATGSSSDSLPLHSSERHSSGSGRQHSSSDSLPPRKNSTGVLQRQNYITDSISRQSSNSENLSRQHSSNSESLSRQHSSNSESLSRQPSNADSSPTSRSYRPHENVNRKTSETSISSDVVGYTKHQQLQDNTSPTVNQILYGTQHPRPGQAPFDDINDQRRSNASGVDHSRHGGSESLQNRGRNVVDEPGSLKSDSYITSGYATTGRSRKSVNKQTVESLRRSKSFHSETADESDTSPNKNRDSAVSVAKFVQKFEKGIENKMHNRISNIGGVESLGSSWTSQPQTGRDLRYSRSFKHVNEQPPGSKNGSQSTSIGHSQSFKHSSNSRDNLHADRYRPYDHSKKTAHFSDSQHFTKAKSYRDLSHNGAQVSGFTRSHRDQLTLNFKNKDDPPSHSNNSESMQLLKKYSQESPTWCGVDTLAKRRWDRSATTPTDPSISSFSKSTENLSFPKRRSEDKSPSISSTLPNRHSYYDVTSQSLATRETSPTRQYHFNGRNNIDETVHDKHIKAPEGDDYKLVFISSDSSKGSEVNTSMESADGAPSSQLRKTKSFQDRKSRGSVKIERNATENNVNETRSDRGENYKRDKSSDRFGHRSDRNLSPIRPRSHPDQYDPDQPPPRPPKPSHLSLSSGGTYFPQVGAIHPSQLHAMLQQTQMVQAEAEAIQAALLKGIHPPERPKSLGPIDLSNLTHSSGSSSRFSRSPGREIDSQSSRSFTIPVMQTNDLKKKDRLTSSDINRKNISTATIGDERRKSRDITVHIQSQPMTAGELLAVKQDYKDGDHESVFRRSNVGDSPARSQSFKTSNEVPVRRALVTASPDDQYKRYQQNQPLGLNATRRSSETTATQPPITKKLADLGRSASDVSEFRRYAKKLHSSPAYPYGNNFDSQMKPEVKDKPQIYFTKTGTDSNWNNNSNTPKVYNFKSSSTNDNEFNDSKNVIKGSLSRQHKDKMKLSEDKKQRDASEALGQQLTSSLSTLNHNKDEFKSQSLVAGVINGSNLSYRNSCGELDIIKLSEEAQRSSNYVNVLETIRKRKSSKERKEEEERKGVEGEGELKIRDKLSNVASLVKNSIINKNDTTKNDVKETKDNNNSTSGSKMQQNKEEKSQQRNGGETLLHHHPASSITSSHLHKHLQPSSPLPSTPSVTSPPSSTHPPSLHLSSALPSTLPPPLHLGQQQQPASVAQESCVRAVVCDGSVSGARHYNSEARGGTLSTNSEVNNIRKSVDDKSANNIISDNKSVSRCVSSRREDGARGQGGIPPVPTSSPVVALTSSSCNPVNNGGIIKPPPRTKHLSSKSSNERKYIKGLLYNSCVKNSVSVPPVPSSTPNNNNSSSAFEASSRHNNQPQTLSNQQLNKTDPQTKIFPKIDKESLQESLASDGNKPAVHSKPTLPNKLQSSHSQASTKEGKPSTTIAADGKPVRNNKPAGPPLPPKPKNTLSSKFFSKRSSNMSSSSLSEGSCGGDLNALQEGNQDNEELNEKSTTSSSSVKHETIHEQKKEESQRVGQVSPDTDSYDKGDNLETDSLENSLTLESEVNNDVISVDNKESKEEKKVDIIDKLEDELPDLKEMEKNDENDEAFDECESIDEASSTSASDTDDDKHVSCGYNINRSSSTSDIENLTDLVEELNTENKIQTERNNDTSPNSSESTVSSLEIDRCDNDTPDAGVLSEAPSHTKESDSGNNTEASDLINSSIDLNKSTRPEGNNESTKQKEGDGSASEGTAELKGSKDLAGSHTEPTGKTDLITSPEFKLMKCSKELSSSLETDDGVVEFSENSSLDSNDDVNTQLEAVNESVRKNESDQQESIADCAAEEDDDDDDSSPPELPKQPPPTTEDNKSWSSNSAADDDNSKRDKTLKDAEQKQEMESSNSLSEDTISSFKLSFSNKNDSDDRAETSDGSSTTGNSTHQYEAVLQRHAVEEEQEGSTHRATTVAYESRNSECVVPIAPPANDSCEPQCIIDNRVTESNKEVVSEESLSSVLSNSANSEVVKEKSRYSSSEGRVLGSESAIGGDGAGVVHGNIANNNKLQQENLSEEKIVELDSTQNEINKSHEDLFSKDLKYSAGASTKRSSSSEGLSSSSDIERSDASDSADTIIEKSRSDHSLRRLIVHQKKDKSGSEDEPGLHESDGPSSTDSVPHGIETESQLSDNSEEGNLISIVAVGGEDKPTLLSHGRIYIRSDSTDSDVQIKPTCIVVTGGSSGAESSEDCDTDIDKKMRKAETNLKSGNDVTILEVTSNAKQDHVMSVQVKSPDSSRSASPTRRTGVSELQDIISATRENQEHFRRPSSESSEPASGLANYFTLTLGFDSPHTPRRHIKTPEIRRRTKTPERTLEDQSKTQSPSPTLTPSPVITPTPELPDNGPIPYTADKSLEEDARSSDAENGEESIRSSYVDEAGQQFSSGGEDEYDEQDSYDYHHDGEDMNDEYFHDDDYDDDDDYDFEMPQEDIKNCKPPFDFKLHTIIEESCEESDYDRKQKDDEASVQDPSELEKYFFFGLGNGMPESKKIGNEESEFSDSFSESSSSIFNDFIDNNDGDGNENIDPAELASSRLEKFFKAGLSSGFERQPSIRSVGEDSELHTDESGSVGSDSEGSPSPEQPRKKLLRPRGLRPGAASRGYSSDRGENPSDGSLHSGEDGDVERNLVSGEDDGSTESEDIAFDKVDGQFDTIKRRKKKKTSSDMSDRRSDSEKSEIKNVDTENKDDSKLTEKLKNASMDDNLKRSHADRGEGKDAEPCGGSTIGDLSDRKYQSRDSGFIGSSDDLLKDKPEEILRNNREIKEKSSSDSSIDDSENMLINKLHGCSQGIGSRVESAISSAEGSGKVEHREERGGSKDGKVSRSSTGSSMDLPPFSKDRIKVSRKDSFNWSSDEETNIMMNRMRAFFRNMLMKARENAKEKSVKSPQMLLFEAKLTSLMKKVPDINDEQVKEIVEYLSSEDTWSDSSEYTASDFEGTYAFFDSQSSELREQISASCQEIIEKFDQSREPSDTDSAHSFFGDRACSESSDDPNTMLMYQRLLSSIGHMKPDSDRISIGSGSQGTSPPLLAKVIHHIGNSLVELMHEVSGGSETGDDIDSLSGRNICPQKPLFTHPDTSFESDGTPTDTEHSPESNTGTPNISKKKGLSVINERSSAEDFTSLESQRTVFASHDSPRHYTRPDSYLTPQTSMSQRSLEERGITSIQYYVTEGTGNEPEVWQSVTIDEDKFDAREHIGVPKARKSNKRTDTRKAKSHMSLEKIHHDDVKTSTGERSESLGDLCDRFRASEFSSSYEQLDSDSTLKASDSLDRHIGSSSSNIRLNASSRGSLTTSSRGSLATSSRGSLQGSSGPEDEEEKKNKKLNFFRYARRSSMPDPQKNNDRVSPEVRSTTLPRSTPAQVLPTATLPRTLPSASPMYRTPPSYSYTSSSSSSTGPDSKGSSSGGPRSARYHAPGYRPPSSKRTVTLGVQRKALRTWATGDDGSSGGVPATVPGDDTTLPASRVYGTSVTTTHHHHPTSPPPASSHHHHHHHHSGGGARVTSPLPSSQMSLSSGGGVTTMSAPNTPSHAAVSSPPAPPKSATQSPAAGSIHLHHRQSPLNRVTGGGGGGGHHHAPPPASLSSSSSLMSCDTGGGGDGDNEVERLLMMQDKRHSLTTLGSRSESMASVCSGGGGYSSVPVRGDVQLALDYSYKESCLQCRVVQCRDLAAVDTKRNRSDPYVKVYLLPDKSKAGKRKTKVKKHSLSPTFDEVLKFSVPLNTIVSRTLWLSVWHSDTFGRNDFLGEVLLPMADVALDDGAPRWYTLQERTEPMDDSTGVVAPPAPPPTLPLAPTSPSRGDISIAMKFVPPDMTGSNTSLSSVGLGGSRRGRRSKGGLYVLIKEAKNLCSMRPNGLADPICKGTLEPEKGRGCKQKTSVCRKTLNPHWEHTMHFDDVSLQDLMERSLVLTVWDHDRLGHSQFLGGCRLNLGRGSSFGRAVDWMDGAGMERLIWEHMLDRVNLWVESTVSLRSNIDRPVYPPVDGGSSHERTI